MEKVSLMHVCIILIASSKKKSKKMFKTRCLTKIGYPTLCNKKTDLCGVGVFVCWIERIMHTIQNAGIVMSYCRIGIIKYQHIGRNHGLKKCYFVTFFTYCLKKRFENIGSSECFVRIIALEHQKKIITLWNIYT